MSLYFFNWLILEARAEIQKSIPLFFGSNENFEICFWDLLTFSTSRKKRLHNSWIKLGNLGHSAYLHSSVCPHLETCSPRLLLYKWGRQKKERKQSLVDLFALVLKALLDKVIRCFLQLNLGVTEKQWIGTWSWPICKVWNLINTSRIFEENRT